ncbi:hypothetical protein DEO72_LG11g1356 [Vigna unguiculata]|uniref:Uncharacterized protein n=1 Tax=Vigna unguiculata TaxID=3917 RepID=A0A4D6NL42_VIGUN|nr:hypothetical protein DEO72_LG11g1356 [Vigna unguiculata]
MLEQEITPRSEVYSLDTPFASSEGVSFAEPLSFTPFFVASSRAVVVALKRKKLVKDKVVTPSVT